MSSLDVAHRKTSPFHKNALNTVSFRRAHSNSSLELATVKPNQPVSERKVGEGKGEEGENVDARGSARDSFSVANDKGKQRGDPPADVQNPPSYGRTLSAHLDSKDSRGLLERLMQARGAFGTLHSSTPPANTS